MLYVSTRSAGFGALPPQPFSAILLEGLAPDGGLAVPERYPRFTSAELAALRPLEYRQLAFAVLSRYADDIPAADLQAIIDRTYTAKIFGSDEIAPLLALDPGLLLLRLSNGPTLAFKDIALQLLANLFEYVLAKRHATLNILGATSGDTGSSAELAMRGKRGLSVFMLSPKGKMSPFQTAQMYSLTDGNIFNIAIDGVFDQCQDMVKAIAGDAAFKRQFHLGAVNSINWARIAAQVVYYFKAYFAATASNDEHVSFAVPSGNFGNVLAGHVAKQMGLPIRHLIVATNENDVLDEFFRTGRYRVRSSRETMQTSSPSMDISKASNFERFVFDLLDRDADRTRELFKTQLDNSDKFSLTAAEFARVAEFGFVSGSSTHADRLATIRDTDRRFATLIDTHTADGLKVAREHLSPHRPMIVLETALPAKFAQAIVEAIGREPERPPAMRGIERLPKRFEVMPAQVSIVKAFIAAHT
jgi:threonine synthase